MTRTIRALAVPLLAAVTHAQDVIHYKFESGGGNKVINYANGDPSAPREGTIASSYPITKAWVAGRFGGGLSAGPTTGTGGFQVDSGWRYRVPGDLTLAFFFRLKYAVSSNFYVICGDNSSRDALDLVVVGDLSRYGWLVLSWRNTSVILKKDVLTAAASRWVHIALVAKPSISSVQLFVDGKPELPQRAPNRLQPIRVGSKTFNVGKKSDAYWSLDEFRLSLRAVPATEIFAWASSEPAAHAPFEKPCHPFGRAVILDGSGGVPKIGNTAYGLTVYGLPQSVVALCLGSNNQLFGGARLPLDLKFLDPQLSGCFLRTSVDLLRFGTIGSTGALSFSLPIPNLPGLSGAKLYSQAVLSSSILNATMLTNAYATVVGK